MMTVPISRIDGATGVVARMRPLLLQYFRRRCRDAVEAEDLAQDVLVRVLCHVHWRSEEEVRAYIFRAAENRWRDRGRRRLTRGETVEWNDDSLDGKSEEITPECVLLAQEEVRQVERALGELSERTRDVLILFKLEQMKIADIATMLGISVSAVNKHLAKALEHLAIRRAEREPSR